MLNAKISGDDSSYRCSSPKIWLMIWVSSHPPGREAQRTAPSGPSAACPFTGMLLRWTCWSFNGHLGPFPGDIYMYIYIYIYIYILYEILPKRNPGSLMKQCHLVIFGSQMQHSTMSQWETVFQNWWKAKVKLCQQSGWNCQHPEMLVKCRIYSFSNTHLVI